jgi:sugar phosphate permease
MTSKAARRSSGTPPGRGHQAVLVMLPGVNIGVVFLDRNAFGLLAPMIQPEFRLSNAQVGMLTGILAVTWSLSGFGLARLADITGRSKLLLIAAMGCNAAVGEMPGAGAMPVAIGWVADQIGLGVLPWILLGVAVLVCLLTMRPKETAPRLAARLAPVAAAA